mmetsp:Transcript_2201/g.8475  ORF Transcript_2201/g.8475 Transcript_2201/m.8475 type:complete len:112 (+) Transcript_2201:3338-3673(+)
MQGRGKWLRLPRRAAIATPVAATETACAFLPGQGAAGAGGQASASGEHVLHGAAQALARLEPKQLVRPAHGTVLCNAEESKLLTLARITLEHDVQKIVDSVSAQVREGLVL